MFHPRFGMLLTLAALLHTGGEAHGGTRKLQFPKGFKWCVATAPHQIEGYNTESDWWDWENLPPACDGQACSCTVAGCEKSGAACDHWNRVEEDTSLLRELGVQQYRMGIEWAKVEPREGVIDWAAVMHYREELRLLREAGVEPMITLQHFTMPRWVRAHGGWEWGGMPEAFERWAEFVFTEIAPDVRDWVTINEPLVHLGGGYALGVTPPGLGGNGKGDGPRNTCSGSYVPTPTPADVERVIPPMLGLLQSHARAYHKLHAVARAQGKQVRVGIAHHLRVFDPVSKLNPLHLIAAGYFDGFWNWAVPEALRTGVLKVSIPTMISVKETIPGLKGTQDFFGLNYYTRDRVWAKFKNGIQVGLSTSRNVPLNDLCWEIYPEGIYRLLKAVHERFPALPVLITENGLADAEDSRRTRFLQDHLKQIHRAMREGSDVQAYCHWSLLDNFEWVEGFGPRFGLYEVDYETQERKARPSALFYSGVARNNGFLE